MPIDFYGLLFRKEIMKKKIAMIMMSTLLLTGCMKQTTTVTINTDASAIIEKKLSTAGSTLTGGSLTQLVEGKFIESIKRQNPTSLLRYNTADDSGIIGIIKVKDVSGNDILASETFFTPKNKKNLSCTKTSCVADFTIKIQSEELDKVLADNELSYKDLQPFNFVLNIPTAAETHNATFFDNEKHNYIWEIPAGVEVPVYAKFNLK